MMLFSGQSKALLHGQVSLIRSLVQLSADKNISLVSDWMEGGAFHEGVGLFVEALKTADGDGVGDGSREDVVMWKEGRSIVQDVGGMLDAATFLRQQGQVGNLYYVLACTTF